MRTKKSSRTTLEKPVATDGLLVFGRVTPQSKRTYATKDRSGKDRGVLSKMGAAGRALYGAAKVSPDVLQANLMGFLQKMDTVFHALPAALGEFSVETLELSVEVTAKGEVGLFGSGTGIEGKGGLMLSLKRTKPAQ
jgi:hypothetical protein